MKKRNLKFDTDSKILSKLKKSDFDGHTEFQRLSPSQRLDWLGEVISFVAEFKGIASKRNIR